MVNQPTTELESFYERMANYSHFGTRVVGAMRYFAMNYEIPIDFKFKITQSSKIPNDFYFKVARSLKKFSKGDSFLKVSIRDEISLLYIGIMENSKLFFSSRSFFYNAPQFVGIRDPALCTLQRIAMHSQADEFCDFMSRSYHREMNNRLGTRVQRQIKLAYAGLLLFHFRVLVEPIGNHPDLPQSSLLKFHSNGGDVMFVGITEDEEFLIFKDPKFGCFTYWPPHRIAKSMKNLAQFSEFSNWILSEYPAFGETILDSIRIYSLGDEKPLLYSLKTVPFHKRIQCARVLIEAKYTAREVPFYFGISKKYGLFFYDPELRRLHIQKNLL